MLFLTFIYPRNFIRFKHNSLSADRFSIQLPCCLYIPSNIGTHARQHHSSIRSFHQSQQIPTNSTRHSRTIRPRTRTRTRTHIRTRILMRIQIAPRTQLQLMGLQLRWRPRTRMGFALVTGCWNPRMANMPRAPSRRRKEAQGHRYFLRTLTSSATSCTICRPHSCLIRGQ